MGGWKLAFSTALAEGGSILVFQTVSPVRKAVVADRHNPISVITLSLTLNNATTNVIFCYDSSLLLPCFYCIKDSNSLYI